MDLLHLLMLNGYMICLNTTNYLMFNMPDFIYWLCTSILNCFGQLAFPLCKVYISVPDSHLLFT